MREGQRRANNRNAVLEALMRGPQTNTELNRICFRYGARILELRKLGWKIQTKKRKGGQFVYTLTPRETGVIAYEDCSGS